MNILIKSSKTTVAFLCLLVSYLPITAQVTNVKDKPEVQVNAIVQSYTYFTDSMYATMDWREFIASPLAAIPIDYRDVDYNLINAAVFYYTNKYRESKRLGQLQFSPVLRDAAVFHSLEMINRKFYDHTNPFNRSMRSAVDRTSYFKFNGSAVGENLAWQFLFDYQPGAKFWSIANGPDINYYYGNSLKKGPDIKPVTYGQFAERLVQEWIDSPPHRHNLECKDFKYLGCGVVPDFRSVSRTHIPEAVGTQNFGG
ncbi:MAG: CAP domain-containing protein [Chitinophagales bacterium]|nr:CAP domain-containing protein [Chitinophagales bacterium]